MRQPNGDLSLDLFVVLLYAFCLLSCRFILSRGNSSESVEELIYPLQWKREKAPVCVLLHYERMGILPSLFNLSVQAHYSTDPLKGSVNVTLLVDEVDLLSEELTFQWNKGENYSSLTQLPLFLIKSAKNHSIELRFNSTLPGLDGFLLFFDRGLQILQNQLDILRLIFIVLGTYSAFRASKHRLPLVEFLCLISTFPFSCFGTEWYRAELLFQRLVVVENELELLALSGMGLLKRAVIAALIFLLRFSVGGRFLHAFISFGLLLVFSFFAQKKMQMCQMILLLMPVLVESVVGFLIAVSVRERMFNSSIVWSCVMSSKLLFSLFRVHFISLL